MICSASVTAVLWHEGKREEGEGGGSGGGSGGHAGLRLLSALLTEMDGMELATGSTPAFCLSVIFFSCFSLFFFFFFFFLFLFLFLFYFIV